jgi:hypothetical protein
MFHDEWYWAVCTEADCLYTHSHCRYVNATSLNMQQPAVRLRNNERQWVERANEKAHEVTKWQEPVSEWSSAMWGDAILFPIHRCWKIINPLFYLHWNRRTKWYETWQWQIYMMVGSINNDDQVSVYPRFAYKNVQQWDACCLLLAQSFMSIHTYN